MQELREVPHVGKEERLLADCLQDFTVQLRVLPEQAAQAGRRQSRPTSKARETVRSFVRCPLQPRQLLPTSSGCLQDGPWRLQGRPRRLSSPRDDGEPDQLLQRRNPRPAMSPCWSSQVSASHKGCGDPNNTKACHRATNKNLTGEYATAG